MNHQQSQIPTAILNVLPELPKGNQVHVWMMFHSDMPVPSLPKPSAILSEQELLVHKRIVTPELSYRFQCSREMLRRTLTLYRSDIPESEWIFILNPYYKPQIHPKQSHANLFFNISHTKGLTVLAISAIAECGIDIENTAVDRPTSYLDIADRYFTKQESAEIKKGKTADQIKRFFDFWTLKEAYIKAVGNGLSLGLDRFEFIVDPPLPIRIDFPAPPIDKANNWVFHQETIATDMRLAVALRADSSDTLCCKYFQYDG